MPAPLVTVVKATSTLAPNSGFALFAASADRAAASSPAVKPNRARSRRARLPDINTRGFKGITRLEDLSVVLQNLSSSRVYLIGREPVMRMSTSLLALCCQSGPDATWETPISARSRSNGSRSLRMSPLLIARFTSASIAP